MYKHLARFLNEKGIKNYSIGQHEGKCTEPYIVISDEGQEQLSGYSIRRKNVDLYIYYPKGKYSELDDYVEQIISTMSEYKRAKFTENVSDVILEADKDAYSVILSYVIYKGV